MARIGSRFNGLTLGLQLRLVQPRLLGAGFLREGSQAGAEAASRTRLAHLPNVKVNLPSEISEQMASLTWEKDEHDINRLFEHLEFFNQPLLTAASRDSITPSARGAWSAAGW